MENTEYLISSFNNIQELIKFTDQKIAGVLIVCGIQISIFYEVSNNLHIKINNLSFCSCFMFFVGFIFIILILVIMYKSIINVLKPRFATSKTEEKYSLYYFEDIALKSKKDLFTNVNNLSPEKQIYEVSEQIYEIAVILNRKNRESRTIMNLLYGSIIILVLFIFTKFCL